MTETNNDNSLESNLYRCVFCNENFLILLKFMNVKFAKKRLVTNALMISFLI